MLTSRRFNTLLVHRIVPPDTSVYTPGCCSVAGFPVFHWRKVKTSSFFRFFEKWVSFSELCEELSAYSAIPGSMWLTHFLPRTKWTHIKGFKRGFWGVSEGSTLIKISSSSQMCRLLCHKMAKAELININWETNKYFSLIHTYIHNYLKKCNHIFFYFNPG